MRIIFYFELQLWDALWSQRLERAPCDPQETKGKDHSSGWAFYNWAPTLFRIVPSSQMEDQSEIILRCAMLLLLDRTPYHTDKIERILPEQTWRRMCFTNKSIRRMYFVPEKQTEDGSWWLEWNDFTVCNDTAGVDRQHRWHRRLKRGKKIFFSFAHL